MKNYKDFRKAAFAVGVGFTVGKYVGDLINGAISGTIMGLFKHYVNHGNEICKEALNKTEGDQKETSGN